MGNSQKWDNAILDLKRRARDVGLTQNDLIKLSGLSACTISQIFNLHRNPTMQSLIKIENAVVEREKEMLAKLLESK